MTRAVMLRIQHRAIQRRMGKPIEVDREEGKAMAALLFGGLPMAEIAKRHGVSARKVQQRFYTMGIYQTARL